MFTLLNCKEVCNFSRTLFWPRLWNVVSICDLQFKNKGCLFVVLNWILWSQLIVVRGPVFMLPSKHLCQRNGRYLFATF